MQITILLLMNMKVVVLDDEKRVCELVCALILWDELGLELAGTASDGEQGLKLIKNVNPDIVITDIKMPALDGLQLIEEAKDYNPDLQFIIISGYRQFDYAKKAIKFGVSDYLLKPINQGELTAALKKLIKVSNEKKKAKGNLSNRDSIRKYYLLDFLKDPKDYNKFSTFFDCNDKISVSLINCDGEFYKYDEPAIEVIRNKLKDVFLCYTNFAIDWELIYAPFLHIFVVLVSFGADKVCDYRENMKIAFHDVVLNFSNLYHNLILTFSLGEPLDDLAFLQEELGKVFSTSLSRLYDGLGCFNEIKKLSFLVDNDTCNNVSEQIERLSIEQELNEKELQQQINVLDKLDYSSFPLTVEAITKKLNIFYKEKLGEESNKICFDEIYFDKNKEQILETFKKEIEKGFSLILEQMKNKNVKPIRIALTYIEGHYFENQLSLDYLSEIVHLSPAYFSALFKKEINIGFSEYLKKIRIEKSKELLASTSLSIKYIANKVGYNDPKHFAKCFIKQVGIKPHDYRKLYG